MRTVKTAAPAPNGSVAGLLGEAAVAITVGLGEGGRSLGEDLGECLEAFFAIGAFKTGRKSPNLSSCEAYHKQILQYVLNSNRKERNEFDNSSGI